MLQGQALKNYEKRKLRWLVQLLSALCCIYVTKLSYFTYILSTGSLNHSV